MNTETDILVVDDEPLIRDAFSQILRRAGYTVCLASTGQQGLQMTRDRRPGVVLLDVMLPDLSGIEVCREIKLDAQLRDVFVVLCSGEATSVMDKVDGFETGADDYLSKPVNSAELLARIRNLLRLRDNITALRISEQRFRQLAENIREAFWMTDPAKNQVVYVSPGFEEIWGQTCEKLYQSPKIWIECIHPDDRERIRDAAHTKQVSGQYDEVYRILRPDGSIRWIKDRAFPIYDDSGKVYRIVGIAEDITAVKQGEKQNQALSLLGYQLNAANTTEQAASIIFEIAAKLFGWDNGFVMLRSQTDNKLVPALMADTVGGKKVYCQPVRLSRHPTPLMQLILKKGARLVNRGGKSATKVACARLDNPKRHSACMMYVPIRSGNLVVGILSIQSYTAGAYSGDQLHLLQTLADHCGGAFRRIEVTAALSAAEIKYRQIFENATEGIFQTTPDGHYRSANPALARILGYQTPEELISSITDIERQTYVLPEQRTKLKRLMEIHGSVQGFEAERYRKDGKKIWTSLNGHVVLDSNGKIIFYEGTLQDISARKQAEMELRRLPQHIIEAQEGERQRVARELHDGVNQIIASAKMRLLKVQDRLAALSPAAREILSRCGQLLNQALEENRRIAHNLRPSDLDELGLATACRNLCKEIQSRTNLVVKSNIRGLNQRLPSHLELHLFRLVQEALHNVEKHAQAKKVTLQIVCQWKLILLKIQDDGCGFKLRKSNREKKRISGVGLTNMRERAAFLGGTFKVVSTPKKGTIITLQIPHAGRKPKVKTNS